MSESTDLVRVSKRFLSDLVSGRLDILALGEEHGLDERELSQWIEDPHNVRCIVSLCTLADLQTQLTLSRCRSVAASRLAQIAGDENEKSETARRASVDLLKLDLKRADAQPHVEVLDAAIPSPQSLYGIDLRLSDDELDAEPDREPCDETMDEHRDDQKEDA